MCAYVKEHKPALLSSSMQVAELEHVGKKNVLSHQGFSFLRDEAD